MLLSIGGYIASFAFGNRQSVQRILERSSKLTRFKALGFPTAAERQEQLHLLVDERGLGRGE